LLRGVVQRRAQNAGGKQWALYVDGIEALDNGEILFAIAYHIAEIDERGFPGQPDPPPFRCSRSFSINSSSVISWCLKLSF
jgi:hypothetical protein